MVSRFFVFFILFRFSELYSQEMVLNYNQVPLNEVVKDLESKFHVSFSFVDQSLDEYQISARVQANNLEKALHEILLKTEINFTIEGKHVYLFRDAKKGRGAEVGSINGIVVDGKTSEPLSYANLLIDSTGWGTYSNSSGDFTLKHIPYGNYYLRITVIGYEYELRSISLFQPLLDLDTIRLTPKIFEGENIVITGEKDPLRISDEKLRIQPSVIILDRKKITNTPGVLEPDLFRAMQTLPGITAPNDITSELFVRGGTPDQNLIMLDRAVIYQPYHMFGIAGIFNTDIIDEVNFSAGGFSSQYGNRLSSVIDVRTKSNAKDKFSGTGTLSLLSSKLTLDGRLNDQWYYLVSGRRTYLDKASKLTKTLGLVGESVPYNFSDLYGKVIFSPNETNQFSVSGFLSGDFYQKTNTRKFYKEYFNQTGAFVREDLHYEFRRINDYSWHNYNFTANWQFKKDWLISTITAYQSIATTDMDQDKVFRYDEQASDSIRHLVASINTNEDQHPLYTNNQINDKTIKWDIELELIKNHKFLLGAEYNRQILSYFWDNMDFNRTETYEVFFDVAPDSFTYHRLLNNYSFYIEDLWNIDNRFIIKPGLRIEKFDQSSPKTAISPRVAARYEYNDQIALKAATGVYYQSHFNSREKGYIGLLEIPFSTAGDRLQKSIHYIAGAEYYPDIRTRFSGEVYYKKLYRMAKNRRSTAISPIFVFGEGYAYGLELIWKKIGSRFSYEAAYSLAWTKRKFEGIEYFTPYDQRHTLSFLGSYKLPKNWSLDFRWTFNSGRAYRPAQFATEQFFLNGYFSNDRVTASEYVDNAEGTEIDHVNIYGRMPIYHRLDVSFIKTIIYKKWTLKPYINIVNSYYKNNPLYYDVKETVKSFQTPEGYILSTTYAKRRSFGIPIVPSFGAHFEF
ncbi:carboxypeptidase-like regulatory domain-containing protein [bacterium]|nr:carboxypeptidase-like regulatory domain-containing protein [bacterium]